MALSPVALLGVALIASGIGATAIAPHASACPLTPGGGACTYETPGPSCTTAELPTGGDYVCVGRQVKFMVA